MGANSRRYSFFVAIILVIAGTAVIFLTRSRDTNILSDQDNRFVKVYIEMALASEMAGNNLDSLNLFYERIFEGNEVDSVWMLDYVSKISYNTDKHKLIWGKIVEKLDSLRQNPGPDSTQN